MMLTLYALMPVLAALGWLIQARRVLRSCDRVRRTRDGLFTCELWRRTYLAAPTPGDFPQPREERVLAWSLAGLPLWQRRRVIALPLNMDAQISDIPAETFDQHFSSHFRLAAPPLRLIREPQVWLAAHRPFH